MSYEERQEDELEFLSAVFPGDCHDLRVGDKWKVSRPPEFQLILVPQKSMGGSALRKRPLSIKLHVKYTPDYPDSVPAILKLEDAHGLNPDLVKELQEQVDSMAADRVGEVMMLEIAQAVQEFLHRHDGPQVSLHEEMLRQQEEKQKQQQLKIAAEIEANRRREEEEHRLIAEEIERKKAELQVSEDDSTDSENSMFPTGKETSPSKITSVPPPSVVSVVKTQSEMDHVHKGRLLGESISSGHCVYVGMSKMTGDLLAVYEWVLQCKAVKKGDVRRLKQVASIQTEYDGLISRSIHHPNLVQYLGMKHSHCESPNQITVELVIEYVGGGSVNSLLSNRACGPISGESHRHFSKQLLESLSYLHSMGVVHNDIRPALVFFETGGSVKLGGHSIIKRLADLNKTMNSPRSQATEEARGVWPVGGGDVKGGKKGDILKLGMVLLCMAVGRLDVSYPPSLPEDLPDTLIDFLHKCTNPNEQLRYPAYELLNHPYISQSSRPPMALAASPPAPKTIGIAAPRPVDMKFERSDSIVGSPAYSCYVGRSRLETEFEELENLGSGGFGDVFKVRNHLDGRLYALKKIVMRHDNRMMSRITREVEMLSQMNHENVVRYYNAWIETYSEEQYRKVGGASISALSSFEEEVDGVSSDTENSLSVESESQGNIDTDDSEVVFMEGFSESSGEGANVLGELESQVMKSTPLSLKYSANELSDTVVFMDSSVIATAPPISINKPKNRIQRESEVDGQVQILYIQMEYCERETLRELIDAGQLHSDQELIWRLFRELVEGLEHIHSKGMIHRDLKPGNVFLNSSGHIKVGDFGLATSHKSSGIRQSFGGGRLDISDMTNGETGMVGTAMYVSPEMLKPMVKCSQKVDIYSLGIIFFEMCHAPLDTAMERHKILVALRNSDIVIPDSLDRTKFDKQIQVIRWLLNHNPHDRPSSKELLQSPLLPLKMEDEELQEVLLRTLQAPDSTRYRLLIDELFLQERSKVQELSYFMEPPDANRSSPSSKKNKFSLFYTLLQNSTRSRLEGIFSRHGGVALVPPLLSPLRSRLSDNASSAAQFIDRSGTTVHLQTNLRVPFARYVVQHNIAYLKRFAITPVFKEAKVIGFHPREHLECQFDIVSPSQVSPVPLAEVMYIVSEVVSELSGFQGVQYHVLISHTQLLSAVLSHCSIPVDKHKELWPLLYKLNVGSLKFSELEKRLKEKQISLSPLALKTLQKLTATEVGFVGVDKQSLLEPLTRDKTSGVRSKVVVALQEMAAVVEQLKYFGSKDNVILCPGLCPTHYSHFSGMVFQFVESATLNSTSAKRNKRRTILAHGGRYDKLLGEFRLHSKPVKSTGPSVVGVSIIWEVLMTRALSAYQHGTYPRIMNCSVMIGWLGHDSMQIECSQLAHDLWSQGISCDLLYESLELTSMEDIQEFCKKQFIQHIVLLADKTLFFERKQVKVRSFESGKFTEKLLTTSELSDFLSQKQSLLERVDSTEIRDLSRSLVLTETQTNILPPINVSIAAMAKLSGHIKRRYHDQAVSKMVPLLQSFSSKQPLEVVIVDFKSDQLCTFASEANKLLGGGDFDFSPVVKSVCDRYTDCNKKYVSKVCESLKELLVGKRKATLIFLYSHTAELCQTIVSTTECPTTY